MKFIYALPGGSFITSLVIAALHYGSIATVAGM